MDTNKTTDQNTENGNKQDKREDNMGNQGDPKEQGNKRHDKDIDDHASDGANITDEPKERKADPGQKERDETSEKDTKREGQGKDYSGL
jgi:hypothetical protein